MMKNLILPLTLLVCFFMLCSCTRTGEKDTMDFVSSMAKYGFDLAAEEISSGAGLKESYYVNSGKISVYSEENGKLYKLTLTYADKAPEDFLYTVKSCIMSFCGFDDAHADEIMKTLGISQPLPDSTMGVARCESEYYLFSFTVDKAGVCLLIDSLRLNPTAAPTVTVRTTVPQVTLTEESSSF